MRLYILGQEIELKDNGKLAQTKQVNDIGSVSTRQTNYTNSFAIPKTAKNIRTFNSLGLVGNNSNVPYQKNECYLYNEPGECFIYKGWAQITETAADYKCNIYDGNLELYKVIENKTLADLDITDLTHDKTLTNVVDSFAGLLPYKYIIADYNGQCLYDTDKINIDYLVPSVKASYLIEQIELYSGFTLNGSFKTNPDFENLWLSYPKGSPDSTTTMIDSDDLKEKSNELICNSYITQTADFTTVDNLYFVAQQDMKVRIEIKEKFLSAQYWFFEYGNYGYDVVMRKNGSDYVLQTYRADNGSTVNTTTLDIDLYYNDSVAFFVRPIITTESFKLDMGGFSSFKMVELNEVSITFSSELSGMKTTDFLKEILWMFGLTLFKNKYENSYDVKTLSEILDTSNAIDWSSKFDGIDSEKYVFQSYAQKNYFRWKYNDDDVFYNDGTLDIYNENLDATKTVVQSNIYTPDEKQNNNLGFYTKVYRLWDKENKDDGTVKYKPKSNHFYFLRSINKDFVSQGIGSASLAVSTTVTSAPVENYSGLSWHDIVSKNYSQMRDIVDKAKISTATFYLKDSDVIDLDFSRLIYIKQQSAYFMLNKINNFIPNTKTKCELIRITPDSQSILSIGDFAKEDFNTTDFYTT